MDWIKIDSENKDNLSDGIHHILVPVEKWNGGYGWWDIITGYVDEHGNILTQSGDMETGWKSDHAWYYKPVGDLPEVP